MCMSINRYAPCLCCYERVPANWHSKTACRPVEGVARALPCSVYVMESRIITRLQSRVYAPMHVGLERLQLAAILSMLGVRCTTVFHLALVDIRTRNIRISVARQSQALLRKVRLSKFAGVA